MTEPRKRCKTCHRLFKRSNPANARYWLLLHLISEKVRPENQTYSPESFHTYFKSKYLGMEEIKMPNGKVAQYPKSSANLDVAEFADFMTKVEIWAQEREVYLEDERDPV